MKTIKGRSNDELIEKVQTALAEKYEATYKSRKHTIVIKDRVRYWLPNRSIINLYFENGRLVKWKGNRLTDEEVKEIVDYLKATLY